MQQGTPSQTAEFVAFARAFESSCQSTTRLFYDPFAYSFLRPRLKAAIQLSRVPLLGTAFRWVVDLGWEGALSSAIYRTRLIDDYLSDSLLDGIDQVVILGAGFDCRAYRTPDIDHVHFFEVDFPTTLAQKKKSMRHILARLPRHVTYADADFNNQSLSRILSDAGLDLKKRAFFIWEGVTQYLTEQAVDDVLTFLGKETAPGSRIVFTYVHKGVLDGSTTFEDSRYERKRLGRINEPRTLGFDPNSLKPYLAERGMNLLENLGAAEYRERYMGPAARKIQGYHFYRAAYAERR
ncbi:MAG: SAM-dependent methyltransferase [Halobacteriota archaeon]